jgi:hypothetical protein
MRRMIVFPRKRKKSCFFLRDQFNQNEAENAQRGNTRMAYRK